MVSSDLENIRGRWQGFWNIYVVLFREDPSI